MAAGAGLCGRHRCHGLDISEQNLSHVASSATGSLKHGCHEKELADAREARREDVEARGQTGKAWKNAKVMKERRNFIKN